MDIAFVVLAHRNPKQLARLARRLAGPGATTWVHIDGQLDFARFFEFEHALREVPGTALLPRRRTPWARIGLVEAMLDGLRVAFESSDAEYFVTLSGQDYPLMSRERMTRVLSEASGASFVPHWTLPWKHWGRWGGLERVRLRHSLIRGQRVAVPRIRKYPAGVRPIGGSQFTVLSRECVADILSFQSSRPDLLDFHRHTWIPDELFFPTVILNAHQGKVLNENVWHIEWPSGDSAHPRTLSIDDFEKLREASVNSSSYGGTARAKLFARKFDSIVDADILDRIDADLLGN